ncbi:hypothetical protein NMG60_11015966 [Bertholletia excelsa]
MAALSKSFVSSNPSSTHLSTGSSLKPANQRFQGPNYLSFRTIQTGKTQTLDSRRALSVQAGHGDHEGPRSASIFIGGFVLGGLVMGTLGCVYAPQISKVLSAADTILNGADKKDLMKKLPKFIYDEDKALKKTREQLAKKIEQLNSAIDDVSAQLRPEDASDNLADGADEVIAAVDAEEQGVAV